MIRKTTPTFLSVGLGLAVLWSVFCVHAAPAKAMDWAKRYDDLKNRVLPNMDEPKGYPGKLEPYLIWLERKAKDRDDVKNAMEEAFDAAHGNPDWGEKFDKLLKEAQRSGENTAWDACFKFLRIKKDDDWQNALTKAREFGRIIYQKAAETKFDPVHVREEWVRCLIRYAIGNVEIAKTGLYEGRESVFAEWDEDGCLVIPKRDFDVNCERRIDFQIVQKGEPKTPVDRGLEWLDEIRKECDWWRFGLERTDVNHLMVAYFKDCLCFLPKEKSHKWYLELARQYQLQEAIDYAQGFYATLKGTVWLDDGKSRKPAAGAVVRVVDPKDNTTWETTAGADGMYRIKDAPLHVHKDGKGRPRCPVFKISARHEGDQTEDSFEGKLTDPNPSAELSKDLVIKRRKAGDLDVDIHGSVNWVHEYPKHRVSLVTDIRITGTMVLHAEKHGGDYQSYRIGNAQMNYSHLFKVHRKVPEKDCPETLETEVTANGSVDVASGSLTIRYPRTESRRARPTGISFDFSQNAPGRIKALIGCNYMVRDDLGFIFGRFQIVDSSPIRQDQKEFSGTVTFGIDPGGDPHRFLRGVPFIFYDDRS
ncbi:MAG: carboxypeptidase-like regulatory domain-containing protein, partial [Desulfosoma sp.]|uniref:carboxypeptidase-like regulatory domain-containing protein n=1 Tax=Desulfosoma sp. TaxID=2603217 RepID=UPI004049881C